MQGRRRKIFLRHGIRVTLEIVPHGRPPTRERSGRHSGEFRNRGCHQRGLTAGIERAGCNSFTRFWCSVPALFALHANERQ